MSQVRPSVSQDASGYRPTHIFFVVVVAVVVVVVVMILTITSK